MREPVIDCAHKYQHPPVAQRQIYADIGVQYSATMNVCDLPLRMRTCLIYIVAPHKYDRECDDNFFGDDHPLQKEFAVDVLDSIKTEAGAACGLTRCPSTDRSVGRNWSRYTQNPV